MRHLEGGLPGSCTVIVRSAPPVGGAAPRECWLRARAAQARVATRGPFQYDPTMGQVSFQRSLRFPAAPDPPGPTLPAALPSSPSGRRDDRSGRAPAARVAGQRTVRVLSLSRRPAGVIYSLVIGREEPTHQSEYAEVM